MTQQSAAPIRFVLFQPSHPGNIGAAARAIKVMGYHDLVLVKPEQQHPQPESRARASNARDVLLNARVTDTLAEAVADCGLVFGASARRRRLNWPEYNPRQCAAEAVHAAAAKPVAIVFGNEQAGLTNDELNLCNGLVYIPSDAKYSSLNLASAVQVLAYECRVAEDIPDPRPEPESPNASSEDIELFYNHFEQVIVNSGFLNPDNPRNLMRRVRRLFNRVHLDENELNIMRGILSSVDPAKRDEPRD
ncbi:MAG: RNA methyltransferase [Gammaproteobacteria bacterium]|nr:RNA methyltransferase [Gammaproteobacteria bacterium]